MGIIEHIGYYENFNDFPEHRHTCCEFLYMHEGSILMISGDDKFRIESGMLYIIPNSVMHRAEIIDKSVYRRTLIFINPWIYGGTYYSDPINDFLMGSSFSSIASACDNFGCESIIRKIRSELETGDDQSENIIASAVTEIVSNVLRQNPSISSGTGKSNPVINDVKKYIREHCGENLLISDIADRFYINKFYLSHIFKEQTGMSPRQYLTLTRLSKAYCMLHDTNLKISKISGLCGFSGPSEMAKKFSEQYGLSPSEFRKKISEKSSSLSE
ncbi:MAG: helix-turn-helix domain-containing protein [Oscillospiraceae bacterium]